MQASLLIEGGNSGSMTNHATDRNAVSVKGATRDFSTVTLSPLAAHLGISEPRLAGGAARPSGSIFDEHKS